MFETEKMLVTSIVSFSHTSSKGFFLGVVITCDYVVNSKEYVAIKQKGTLWDLWKVLTLVSLHSPRGLTMVETFRYWQIFCVLSDNST